jgi:putative hemolysin
MIVALIIIVLLCVATAGFFSGAETALVSVDKPLLESEAVRGNARAQLARRLLQTPARFLATTLVGTNLCLVTATSLATLIARQCVAPAWQSVVTTAVMTPFILVFAELLPKSIGRGNARGYALTCAPLLYLVQTLIAPVVTLVSATVTRLLRLLGVHEQAHGFSVSREEVRALTDISVEHGVIGDYEYAMIRRVFELNQTSLSSVMVPLIELVCLPVAATLEQVLCAAETCNFRRFPVYDGRPDNIIGLVDVLDVLDAAARHGEDEAHTPLGNLVIRDVPFLPEMKPVGRMLRELQDKRVPVVFVVDEYGGVTGMVTIQNIAEEIVGELAAQNSADRPFLIEHRNGIDCDGRVDVDTIGEHLRMSFDKDGYDTIAGLMLKLAGRVPGAGEVFTYRGLTLTVVRATRKRIVRVRISRKQRATSPTDTLE